MAARHVYAAGETLTAANKNLDTSGNVAAPASVTANQGSITAVVDLTSLTITFTAISGYRYLIRGRCLAQSTVATDSLTLVIADGSNTQIQQGSACPGATSQNVSLAADVVVTPSSGSVTYKLRALRSGTGTMQMTATATAPATLSIEDIGSV